MCVFVSFPSAFEAGVWALIVLVFYHCLPCYFTSEADYEKKVNCKCVVEGLNSS